jgi:hypothetical protein
MRAKMNDRRNRGVPPQILRFEVESDIRQAGLGALHDRHGRGYVYRSKDVVRESSGRFVRYTIGCDGHYRIKATALVDFSQITDLTSMTIDHEMIPPGERCVNASFRTLETDAGRAEVARLLMRARRELREGRTS